MRIDYSKAKKLCNATEFALLEDAKPVNLASFPAVDVRKKISRARAVSDKWRDQAKSQGHFTDGRAARSLEKHELFAEAVRRFEVRLGRLTAPPAAKKAVRKAAKRIPVPPKSPRENKSQELATQANMKAVTTRLRIEASGLNSRIRGHVSSRGRRAQAVRQSRN